MKRDYLAGKPRPCLPRPNGVGEGLHIKVNEKEISVPSHTTLYQLKKRFKPKADVIIYNGFPLTSDQPLTGGDEIVFIQKGEFPSSEDFECFLMARHTRGPPKIKGSVVGIAGLGGLGSAVAIALARIGLGTLILVDFDVVEPSNLNRQQYFIHQVGILRWRPSAKISQESTLCENPNLP
jgi:sulfur carrier protein ThiS adenylyltransferase